MPPEITPEIQALIDQQVSGLKAKNDELLGKLAKKDTVADTIKSLGVTVDELVNSHKELSEYKKKSAEEKGEYKTLYETLKNDHEKTTGDLQKQLNTLLEQNHMMKKQNELSSALSKHDLVPELFDTAISTIIGQIALDDKGEAKVGSKPVKDFVDSWVTGPVGKHFIKNNRSGGGAEGGDGSEGSEEVGWFKKGTGTFNLTKQANLAKTNPTLYKKLKEQYG